MLSRADTLAFILSTIAPFPVKSIPDIVTAICSILSLAGVTTVIITGISFIIAQIYRNANTYLLTHDRIIIRRSLLSSIRREIPYSKISDVTIEQTLLGRIFGYGDVIPISISGFGITGQERYPSEKRLDQLDSVAKPREISQRILTHMRA